MKVKRTYLLAAVTTLLFGFQNPWKEKLRIPAETKEMRADLLGNVYLLNTTNQFSKYDAEGNLKATLNYSYQGNISQFDVSNPMEIYLLYRELNRVVFLDNNLAFRGEIDLNTAGITQAAAIGRSYSNGLWVFDMGDMQLKKLNKEGKLLQESGNTLQFAQGRNLFPRMLQDDGSRVMVLDSTAGILFFDVFANYLKTVPAGGATSFQSNGKEIHYLHNNQLLRYQIQTLKRDTLDLPSKEVLGFSMSKEQLFLREPKMVRGLVWED